MDAKENRMIFLRITRTKLINHAKPPKSYSKGLFQIIKSLLQVTDFSILPVSNKSKWLLTINLLIKNAMAECFLCV